MGNEIPRLVIAGLSGDSGKTVVSLALLAALRRKGLAVSTFKKGPDYIDAAWLTAIGQTPCRNLDTFLVSPGDVFRTFARNSLRSGFALIEGNRGVFDGRDAEGTHSTAELAKLLGAPVVLVVNVTKTTRTIAALVKGIVEFDREVRYAGVVLNRVAGRRHERILRDTIERYCRLPVLGAIPKLGSDDSLIPGRHLGLVTPAESETIETIKDSLARIADNYLDIDRLIERAGDVAPLEVHSPAARPAADVPVRIGYFHDRAFTFYYPENLEALQAEGAELVPVSSIDDPSLPEIDALYIGGGFPETHTRQLGGNRSLMQDVKRSGESGLPIYAECGGLIYLCRSLQCGEDTVAMADLFPVDLVLQTKPAGHGYVEAAVDRENPFYRIGQQIRGHEFHYTRPITEPSTGPNTKPKALPNGITTCLQLTAGSGLQEGRDGLVYRNVFASYVHIHADGVKSWASALAGAARQRRRQRQSGRPDTEAGHGTNVEGCEVRPCVLTVAG